MKMGSGAGRQTGTQGGKGFPSKPGSTSTGAHQRNTLRTYREGVTPSSNSRQPSGGTRGENAGKNNGGGKKDKSNS